MRALKKTVSTLIAAAILLALFACSAVPAGPGATPTEPGASQAPPPQTAAPEVKKAPEPTPAPISKPTPEPTPEPTPQPPAEITMCVLGDVLVHNTQLTDAYNEDDGTYDFTHCFRYIRDHVTKADIAFCQLETTFGGGPNYAGYPNFNTPDAMAYALSDMGVDLMGLAGNHVLDKGYKGLVRTLDTVKSAGITPIGAYATQEEREENGGVVLLERNGIRIAFLAYTYGTNGIPLPSDKPFVTNLLYTDYLTNLSVLNKDQILADLSAAGELEPDLIVAITHWGSEYATKQNKHQEEAAGFLFENGVDVILGSHCHVLEPYEKRTITTVDGEEKEVFVSFCLGNLISAQKYDYTNLSAMLNLSFEMDRLTRKVVLKEVSYIPIYTVKGVTEGPDYHVLPIHEGIKSYETDEQSEIGGSLYKSLLKGLGDIHSILGSEGDPAFKPPAPQ